MNSACAFIGCLLLCSCASDYFTKDKDGKMIYADTSKMQMETPPVNSPYVVFIPPLPGCVPDSVSTPPRDLTKAYPVYVPTVPSAQGVTGLNAMSGR